jgi:hypothetical protein
VTTTVATRATEAVVPDAKLTALATSVAGGPAGATEFDAGVAARAADVDVGDVAVANIAAHADERGVPVWIHRLRADAGLAGVAVATSATAE